MKTVNGLFTIFTVIGNFYKTKIQSSVSICYRKIQEEYYE